MSQNKHRVKAKFVPLNIVKFQDVLDMHNIFRKYYSNTTLEVFMKDMSEKEGLIILKDKAKEKIVGFSTVKKVEFEVNNKRQLGVFSGDTVLEQHYWGNKALQTCFSRYLIKTKFMNLFRPVYWLLISKGYKTYLLMANNFINFYPRKLCADERKNRQLKEIAVQYCQLLFPSALNKEQMVLDFGEGYQQLKQNVAEITPELRSKNPNIDFFEQCNPDWRKGIELPCVGEVSVSMLAQYVLKVIKRGISRPIAGKDKAPIYR